MVERMILMKGNNLKSSPVYFFSHKEIIKGIVLIEIHESGIVIHSNEQ